MIGILTFQTTNNFGAYLHTIALQKKIVELGYNCEIINYRCPELIRRETEHFEIKPNLKSIIKYFLFGRVLRKKYINLKYELESLTQVSQEYTPYDIYLCNNKYDSFLLGSDVVWSLRVSNKDYNYFFKFLDNDKKRNAFSSSVGETDLYKDDPNLPGLLQRFDQIAVREEEAVEWVKIISGKDASYVCDPTMLFTSKEWDEIISPKTYKSDYVLIYFNDPLGKLIHDAKAYALNRGLKVKFINYGMPVLGLESVRPTTLAEFIGLVKYSKAVFTASYHGMLFSLYYHKELFFYNRSYKSRMNSLASKFGIEDHNGDNFVLNSINPINFDAVDKLITEFRKDSLLVLNSILQKS